jgi:flagellar L-ring protein precursor FlgH
MVLLGGCAVTPTSIIQQPSTMKPVPIAPNQARNGAIFNVAAYEPLFEDKRARNIGDIMTIAISENTAAAKQGGSSASKNGAVDASVGSLLGSPLPKADFSASSSNQYEDKSALKSSNNFTGIISVTVIDVLANGNLVVSGEKQISLDKGSEFVRFSGVVNPDYIRAGNVITSTQVADARIEYRTNSRIDAAQVMSILTRFFLSFAPL